MVLGIDTVGLYGKGKVERFSARSFNESITDDYSYVITYIDYGGYYLLKLYTASFVYAFAVVNFIYNEIRETTNEGSWLYFENAYKLSLSAETTFEQRKRGQLVFKGVVPFYTETEYTEMEWDRYLPPIPLLAITSLLL